jgi:lipoprotein-anchoring transpeptidase ErfK/SrfK
VVALIASATGSALVAPAQATAAAGPRSQPLVALMDNQVARTGPGTRFRRVERVAARRPLTRVRTILPALRYAKGRDGRTWVRVRLPGRPNGHTGWILASQTKRRATDWRLVLDLSARRVTVYNYGRVERRYAAVVGTRSTPTPRGRFFIEEALALSPQAAGGPFALATSARSSVLKQFAGGPGQIALHGTKNLEGALGTAASHGCIRLSTRAITWLARRIGRGVPLTIKR